MIKIYQILSILLHPIIVAYIHFRASRGKEDKNRLQEKFGFAGKKRPQGQVVWMHAVSVGETNSALILVDEILKFSPKTTILFTTITVNSANLLQEKIKTKYKDRLIHQFLPVDSYVAVRRFLKYWQPKAALFLESEIWPNFILESHKQGILSFLINARMSEKSTKRWQIARKFGVNIFDYFLFIFAQTKEYEKNFAKLTEKQLFCYGNLKSQAQTLKFDEKELEKLKTEIGQRPFWLAASTHQGEEKIIFETHKRLKEVFPDILTIIIIRHPNRAGEVINLLEKTKFAQRSKKQKITKTKEVYLVDTIGEVGLFYKLSDFALICGSLKEIGGHNPFEAIKLNCAVLSGENVFNFKDIYNRLSKSEACVMVKNEDEIFENVKNFLQDDKLAKEYAKKANKVIEDEGNISQKIVKKIDGFLPLNI